LNRGPLALSHTAIAAT